jgi:Mrp family chromosome partitioning ATPase
MAQLVVELRERYDTRFVLFDLPPLLGTADALSFLPLFECALLIVEEGRTTQEEITECKRLLGQTPLVGAVVNKGSDTADHYFYTDAKKR